MRWTSPDEHAEGSITNVRFDEWNLGTDTPFPGGRCFIVPSGSVTAPVQ